MTGRQIVARVVLAVLVVGLLAAAGYAIYRLGFNAGMASADSTSDLRGFLFERGSRFGWPDRFHPRLQEPMMPGVRVYAHGMSPLWRWAWSSWFGLGVLVLAAGAVIGLVVVLFRWAFRPAPKPDAQDKSAG